MHLESIPISPPILRKFADAMDGWEDGRMRDAMAALHFDGKIEIQDKQRAEGSSEGEESGGALWG